MVAAAVMEEDKGVELIGELIPMLRCPRREITMEL